MSERLAITEPGLLLVLLVGCVFIIYFGRVETAAGIYYATQRWAYSVDVGPTVWVWLWLFTLGASAIVFHMRQPASPRPRSLLDRRVPGIVVWGVFWLFWIFVCWYSSPTTYATGLVKNILVYDLPSFVAISLFGSDLSRVKTFAFAFIGATLTSGLVTILSLPDLSEQLQISGFVLRGIDEVNYLAFAVPFAIAPFFLLVFLVQATRWWYKIVTVVAIVFCIFCLLLTGARQSIVALAAAWMFFITWISRQRRFSRRSAMAALVLSLLAGILLYSQTALISRWIGPQADLENLGGRIEVWQEAWSVFLHSPISGSGFDYFGKGYSAHDLWLDVLAGQGIVGFSLLNGFLFAVLHSTRGTWTGIGSEELASWRMGAFCVLVYALVQAIPGGTIGASVSHLLWTSALVWRLGVAAQGVDSTSLEGQPYSTRIPQRRAFL